VIVNKRVNQRFFYGDKNPPAGLVIDDEIVGPHYNFFLIAHGATIGTLTPTHYNVIVNHSDITCKALYDLTYGLCHLYYNWQGGIRVPAPCMYAHKIAYLVGKITKCDFNRTLAGNFFYL